MLLFNLFVTDTPKYGAEDYCPDYKKAKQLAKDPRAKGNIIFSVKAIEHDLKFAARYGKCI